MNSLRRTVSLGYQALATIIVGLSLFAFFELRLVGEEAIAGERVSEFFGITLEIRRFEKNYFLYHQEVDLSENRDFVSRALGALTDNRSAFATFASPAELLSLQQTLRRYDGLMAEYALRHDTAPARAAELALAIRSDGKVIIDSAEEIARTERQFLRDSLARQGQLLLGSIIFLVILAVAIGHYLSRRVARPLKRLEAGIEDIASGRKARLDMVSRHREVASLIQAFNHVMAELELRQKRQLVRAEKLASLGTLLSEVAHELNNPLSNISTSCQILLEEGGESDSEFHQQLLGQIDEQTVRARHIVRSLLDYARDTPFCGEAHLLSTLLDETLHLVRGQAPITMDLTVDVPAELQLFCDKQRLQQAFINLIRNAQDALGEEGKLHISARRRFTTKGLDGHPPHLLAFGHCEGRGEVVDIEFSDNGPGIPEEVLPRIFDPFFTTKELGKGSGLGLFIVFEVVEEHGGCIAVEAPPGQGTTFFIRLPTGEGHHLPGEHMEHDR
jgi:signal transduction histidine kinase